MLPVTTTPAHYVAQGFEQTGYASWYGKKFQGKPTASGKPFDMYRMTAASSTLPLFSRVKVTNLQNGKSDVVLIIDREPPHAVRIIDLSYVAARGIGIVERGEAKIRVTVLSTPLRRIDRRYYSADSE